MSDAWHGAGDCIICKDCGRRYWVSVIAGIIVSGHKCSSE